MTGKSNLGSLEEVLLVELELVDALLDVVQSSVRKFLGGGRVQKLGVPPPGQLLDGGDVDDAVVKVLHQVGHELAQKFGILKRKL